MHRESFSLVSPQERSFVNKGPDAIRFFVPSPVKWFLRLRKHFIDKGSSLLISFELTGDYLMFDLLASWTSFLQPFDNFWNF